MIKFMCISPGCYLELATWDVNKSTRARSGSSYYRTYHDDYGSMMSEVARKYTEYKPDAVVFETNLAFESANIEMLLAGIAPFRAFHCRYSREMGLGLEKGDNGGELMSMMSYAIDRMLSFEKIESESEPVSSHSSTVMADHKRNFANLIEPGYGKVAEVDTEKIRKRFQEFADEMIADIPDGAPPQDPYPYNAHIGDFLRLLGHAKDSYGKGLLAYYKKRKTDKTEKS